MTDVSTSSPVPTTPDTPRLRFQILTKRAKYDDGIFIAWTIRLWFGSTLVGEDKGPRRAHRTHGSARRSALTRVKTLRSHRLYLIRITRKHIRDGVGRSCSQCAISQALWHNQDRMGFPRGYFSGWNIEVESYGAWTDPRGIVFTNKDGGQDLQLPLDKLPKVVMRYARDGKRHHYSEDMAEWTQAFDEWADVYGQSNDAKTLTEYRQAHGYDGNEYPTRPAGGYFVLDLDELQPLSDA